MDDTDTAHAFMAAKEKVLFDEHRERPVRGRCSDGKAVGGACIKRGVRREQTLPKETWAALDYAAYALQRVGAGQ